MAVWDFLCVTGVPASVRSRIVAGGRSQLLVYHFMFGTGLLHHTSSTYEGGSSCSWARTDTSHRAKVGRPLTWVIVCPTPDPGGVMRGRTASAIAVSCLILLGGMHAVAALLPEPKPV